MRKNTILIVDDDFNNLKVLGGILRDNNHSIIVATDGYKALECLQESLPDLIILDVMMPGIDGYETCRRIKSIPKFQSTPVLFLSALDDVDEMVKGMECGAYDYILKPVNAKLLLSKIQVHIELKNKTEELENLNRCLEYKVQERTIELQKANEELSMLDEAKMEFLRIISHEIRTPLNGILGFTSILKQECQNANISQYIKHLDTSVDRLESFSLKALLFTQLRTGKYTLKKENISFKKVIDEILNKYEQKIAGKNISVISGVPADISANIDYSLVLECIGSIMDNAVKYAPSNSEINISVYKKDGQINCRIADQGKGFSEKALNNLFSLFKPGDNFVNENEGIELALCKLIMMFHDGDIKVGNYAEGAEVILTF